LRSASGGLLTLQVPCLADFPENALRVQSITTEMSALSLSVGHESVDSSVLHAVSAIHTCVSKTPASLIPNFESKLSHAPQAAGNLQEWSFTESECKCWSLREPPMPLRCTPCMGSMLMVYKLTPFFRKDMIQPLGNRSR
jgi:hypothetical protein